MPGESTLVDRLKTLSKTDTKGIIESYYIYLSLSLKTSPTQIRSQFSREFGNILKNK